MPNKFENAVAIVTGAAGGLGSAISAVLYQHGTTVYMVDINLEKLAEKRQQILNQMHRDILHNSLVLQRLDLTNISECEAFIANLPPKVNILINCAAVNLFGPFKDVTSLRIRSIIEVNLLANLYLSQMLLPRLILAAENDEFASLIFISSLSSQVAIPYLAVYEASKTAVNTLAHVLYSELRPFKVHIGVVQPGNMETPMQDINNSMKSMNFNKNWIPIMGKNAIPPTKVADKIVIQIMKKKKMLKVASKNERILIWLNTHLPFVDDLAMAYIAKKQLKKN